MRPKEELYSNFHSIVQILIRGSNYKLSYYILHQGMMDEVPQETLYNFPNVYMKIKYERH